MTTISPYVGAASLAMPSGMQSTMSLQEALAGGSSIGGTASSPNFGITMEAPGGANAAPQVAGVTGGGAQAVQGAATVDDPRAVAVLQQAIEATKQLIAAHHAAGLCGMPGGGAAYARTVMQGPAGAPRASAGLGPASEPAPEPGLASEPFTTQEAPAAAPVRDRTSTRGLQRTALRGLEEAHRFGLPLVSGYRPGGSSRSDHAHGRAIDVADIPIGDPKSTQGSPRMRAYAEHMRQEGKAGRLAVKYVILDGRIASATDDWAWRPYTYPGKSRGELQALKASNRGEYNRLQHFDHVHVSFR